MADRTGLLEEKVTVITGASSGIGAAAARLFAREGARVVLAARREDRLEALASELAAEGYDTETVVADVSSLADVRAIVERALSVHGRLDCAFNNAGVTYLGGCAIGDSDEADVIRLLDINLVGVWRCIATEVHAMRRSGGGSIVNTSSIGGFKAGPRLGPYPASKHGVIGLTLQAAVDHGPEGIRVNCVAPGGTMTEMIDQWSTALPGVHDMLGNNPLARAGEPEEIAEAACWLLSDRASYVTGTVLTADGGALA
jgi:NAD(P)-dependent dehydrogenase (short-subunit alcohol dehydrogenase family)